MNERNIYNELCHIERELDQGHNLQANKKLKSLKVQLGKSILQQPVNKQQAAEG